MQISNIHQDCCYYVLHPVSLVNKKQLIIIKRNMSTGLVKEILLSKSSQYRIPKYSEYLLPFNEKKSLKNEVEHCDSSILYYYAYATC